MKKLTLLACGTDADAIVRKLMKLRCVEIRPLATEDGLTPVDMGEIDRARENSERRLADIRRALPILGKYTSRKSTLTRRVHRVDLSEFVRNGRDEDAWQTVTQTLAVDAHADALRGECADLRRLMQSLEPWLTYDAPLGQLSTARTSVRFGVYPPKTDPVEVRDALEAAGALVEVVLHDETGLYLALTVLHEEASAVDAVLLGGGCLPVKFPNVTTTARLSYDNAEERIETLTAELFHLEERLRDLADGIDAVEILSDIEGTNVAVCEQKRKLTATRRCVVLQGWVPTTREAAVTEALSKFECVCEMDEACEDDEPPVLLRNGRIATTFEWVIGMYSYPKYGTFDPTAIMSIFYFLIFGMMFADVGYGLLLTIACFGGIKLLNPRQGMRRMLLMFGYCGISCMIMGVLFGGWFGNLPTAIMNSFVYHAEGVAETTPLGSFFYNGLIFNPIDSSIGFLVLAIAMGEIHLIAGMAINMVQTGKRGHWLTAVCSTVPFWVLFAGIDLLAPALIVDMFLGNPTTVSASLKELFATLSVIGKYTMFAGFGLIFLCNGVGQKSFVGWLVKGLGGLYSLIGFASDLLSYSRILALGLVAGVIAQVINMMTGLGATGPVGFVFMLIVMIAGHGLNLAINLLGTFVHAARLQYIEFFGKFYEDGGEPFSPALPVEEYTESISEVPNTIS